MRNTGKSTHLRIRQVKGSYRGAGLKFGIIVSEFNEYLTRQLLEGALDSLLRHGARVGSIQVVHVPGAFEIPLAAGKLLRRKKVDAVIALAVVIRGQTKHFNQVTRECAQGIRELSRDSQVPIILGMVTAQNERQAIERVGLKRTNKGREWALAAIEMANLMKQL